MILDDGKLFRERLRLLRESQGLTQGQLEERIGKEANYITRVETGRIDTPPFETLSKIARELSVSMSDLFFFEGVDDSAEVLRSKIQHLLKTDDVERLRKYYRLMMVSQEK
jgi:transcriptional regulator with XRE-family HTH domain